MTVNHRPRRFGHSKYGVRRFARGFLDLLTVKFLTGFGERPQHILGGFGLFFFALGFLGLFYLGCVWCATHIFGADFGPIGTRPLLPYSIAAALLGGASPFAGADCRTVGRLHRTRDRYVQRGRAHRSRSARARTGIVDGAWKMTVRENRGRRAELAVTCSPPIH